MKDFLKRHNRDDRRHHFLIIRTAKHRFSNSERHFLGRTNNLRSTDDEATPAHLRQYLADTRVNFFELDHVLLKRAVRRSIYRPKGEGDQVRVFLERFFQALVVARVVQSPDTAGDLECSGEAGNDVAIPLAVEFDLAGFILHELGLVATLERAQLVGTAVGKEVTREGERQQADQEEDSKDYEEETDSSEFFEHSWFWRYNRRQVPRAPGPGVPLLLSSPTNSVNEFQHHRVHRTERDEVFFRPEAPRGRLTAEPWKLWLPTRSSWSVP